jgi:uncharacterized protein YneF (UPF0154 family)
MIEQLTSIVNYFFNFFLFFAVFIVLILTLSEIYFKNFKLKKDKLRFYGIFLNLTNGQIISITFVTLKFIYIFYSLINIGSTYITLIFLMFLTFVFNLFNFRAINIVFDTFSCIIIYLIILSKDIFFDYVLHVDAIWYAVLLCVATMLFGLTVALYLYIKDVMYVLKKNIYVKKEAIKTDMENAIFKPKQVDKMVKELKDKVGGVAENDSKSKSRSKEKSK